LKEGSDDELVTSKNMDIHPRLRPLYNYLISNGKIVDLEEHDPDVLWIQSRTALQMIKEGKPGWEKMVPNYVDVMIKKNLLFGYKPNLLQKEKK
jgi:hypothetical protein